LLIILIVVGRQLNFVLFTVLSTRWLPSAWKLGQVNVWSFARNLATFSWCSTLNCLIKQSHITYTALHTEVLFYVTSAAMADSLFLQFFFFTLFADCHFTILSVVDGDLQTVRIYAHVLTCKVGHLVVVGNSICLKLCYNYCVCFVTVSGETFCYVECIYACKINILLFCVLISLVKNALFHFYNFWYTASLRKFDTRWLSSCPIHTVAKLLWKSDKIIFQQYSAAVCIKSLLLFSSALCTVWNPFVWWQYKYLDAHVWNIVAKLLFWTLLLLAELFPKNKRWTFCGTPGIDQDEDDEDDDDEFILDGGVGAN